MKRLLWTTATLLVLSTPSFAETSRTVSDCTSTGLTYTPGSRGQDYAIGTDGKICGTSSGSGGAGDASAANQASQITQETAFNTALGVIGNSEWSGSGNATVISLLKYIALGVAGPVPTGTNGIGTIDPTTAANWGIGAPAAATPAKGVLRLGRAASTDPTAVTDGQSVAPMMSLNGKQVVLPFTIKELAVRGTADSTDGSAHTIIASAGGSLKNYITDWECHNTSATNITVTFTDSVSTKILVPATGGNNKSLQVPLVTAAATAFQFTASTGVSTVTCNAQGFTGL
jgi:hypothetical protein